MIQVYFHTPYNFLKLDEKLRSIGYDAFSVKKLRADGLKLHTDFSVINYAMENKT